MAFSPHGKALAAGDSKRERLPADPATGGLATGFHCPGRRRITAVAFSPDGQTLAGRNGRTYLWKLATRKLPGAMPDPAGNGGI